MLEGQAISAGDVELRPAKINDRFIAYLFDTLPFAAGYYFTLLKVMSRSPALAQDKRLPYLVAGVWIWLYWLYHFIGNLTGGTIGKRLMGIRVVSRSGEAAGAGRSFLRALGSVFSNAFFNFGYIVALFNPESRALHDWLAGTLVIESRPKNNAEAWLLFGAAVTSVTLMFGSTFYFTLNSPTPTDLRAIARAKDGAAILAKIEESYFASHGAYTDSLLELAKASGDVDVFRQSLQELFDPHLIVIKAGNRRYLITVAAQDRKKSPVSVTGTAKN